MTELIWDGKYKDAAGGGKQKVAPVRIALPFQTIETVNESAQDRLRTLDMFASGKPTEWRNRLIWGDKKYVLPSLLPEFAGKVNLIYIDPPFDTGADFSFNATLHDHPDTDEDEAASFVKEPSIIEQKAYRDTWGRGLDSYLQWFFETILLLRELLAENGSIYVHCDWHVGHYMKALLDEVFGYDNFRNQIVWQRFNFHADARRFGIVSDEILFYGSSSEIAWNPQSVPIKDTYIQSHFRNVDADGRRYKMADILAKGQGPPRKFGNRVLEPPPGTHWRFGQEKIDELMKQERIAFTKEGNPAVKMYLDEKEGSVVHNIWTDIPPVNPMALERADYPTQKPESLLERIIKSSSNEGNLILDCFCGSGTTAAVAEKLNRRWIACDLGRFAIHTTRKRLLQIPNVKPFVVQNLGKYERQAWAAAEFHSHPLDESSRRPSPSPAGRRGDDHPSLEGRGAGGEGEELKRKWQPPYVSKEMRERARKLRKKATPAEEILWDVLRDRQLNGLKFRRQHVIDRYIVDFYCAEHKLAVELDGPVHDAKEQQEKDKLREQAIQREKIQVIRFKNDQVFDDLESVLSSIVGQITPLQEGEDPDLATPLPTGERKGVREMAQKEKAYRNFILELYHAEPVTGYVWLHGAREKRMVHVGAVDSPVALGDVKTIIQEFWKSVGKHPPLHEGEGPGLPAGQAGVRLLTNGIDILGWEFAFDINETARQQAAASKVDVKFKKIPREVLDKKAIEQGDVHFFELAGLDVRARLNNAVGQAKSKGRKVELTLKEFIIPPDDVPEDVRASIVHWSQWVDYWAVDWNYRDDTFHNEWQSYRTKKETTLQLTTAHEYEEKGTYTIVVKVIDILGNDTTKALTVDLPAGQAGVG